jgi:nitroimidazol reductase NimA-like FMN-containing flavoprotein (pyridoxamine 5'-phosphate oxidase superfamily)
MISPTTARGPDSDDRSERDFVAIDRQQCLDFIESHHLSRVAWQPADLPQILLVTYAMHQGSVYFRTLPDGILAEPTSVALELDALDQQTRSGCSIVPHGRTSAVSEPDELADLWASDSMVPSSTASRLITVGIQAVLDYQQVGAQSFGFSAIVHRARRGPGQLCLTTA